MSRIRSIHPKILTDEAFMALTVDCPLAIPLLLGLWMEADDSGTFEWKMLTLKARILPAPSVDIGHLLGVLCEGDFIRRFDIGGKPFGVIRNFVRYQRPKSPQDTFPFSEESRSYAGFVRGKRPRSETGRPPSSEDYEPLPNSSETTSTNAPQREEEGGRREEEETQPHILEPASAEEKMCADDWNRFDQEFPWQAGMSKDRAKAEFYGLETRDLRLASIGGIAALKARKPTTYPLGADRYLAERRFESCAPRAATVPKTVFVQVETPQWEAWKAEYRRQGKTSPPTGKDGRGWQFPSEWPPSHERSLGAA